MSKTEVEPGVLKELVKAGEGQAIVAGQNITVHCTGSLAETGTKFWSTRDAGQKEFSFEVGKGKVIRGWDAGCLTMRVGETAKLTVSGEKGYGAKGFPAWGITPNAVLLFEIEVLSAK